jgi:hypothetical protein
MCSPRHAQCWATGKYTGILTTEEASSCRSTEEYKKSVVEREWEFSQLSMGDSHGKLIAQQELEVSLWRLSVWLEAISHSETFLIPLPGYD